MMATAPMLAGEARASQAEGIHLMADAGLAAGLYQIAIGGYAADAGLAGLFHGRGLSGLVPTPEPGGSP